MAHKAPFCASVVNRASRQRSAISQLVYYWYSGRLLVLVLHNQMHRIKWVPALCRHDRPYSRNVVNCANFHGYAIRQCSWPRLLARDVPIKHCKWYILGRGTCTLWCTTYLNNVYSATNGISQVLLYTRVTKLKICMILNSSIKHKTVYTVISYRKYLV